MTFSERVAPLQPTAVNTILQEVRALQAEGCDLISLMRGEPDFPTPPHIVEAAARALRDGRTSYPDNRGEPALRTAIADKLQSWNGLGYDPGTEILVTTGATFGIYAALAALIDPGHGVLVPDPVYDAYASVIRLAGGCMQPVRAALDHGRYSLPVDALESARTASSKALLLNTPWNPVGTVLREPELQEIAAFAERHNLAVISDEIYEAITYGAPHRSIVGVSPSLRGRCVLINSFSKTYAMTGWRAGYCAGPPALISAMYLVLQQSSRGPATFVQDAAAAALNGDQTCVRAMRDEYTERRRLVLTALTDLDRVRPLPPEGGFFAMADAREAGIASDEIRRRLLREAGVVVVHGAAYGAAGEGTLRISFASGGVNLARGLERLRAGLEAL
jgi:aspartate/methionine/tyrosine aminotransferase